MSRRYALRDLRVAGARRDAEHLVGVGEPRIRARAEPRALRRPTVRPCRNRPRACAAWPRAPRTRAARCRATRQMRGNTARGRSLEAVALQRGLELDLHEQAAQVGADRRRDGAGARASPRAESRRACRSVKRSIARAPSASFSEKRRIASRAASISCSVTRPSALATWPMTWNVARKNARAAVRRGSAAAVAGRDRPRLRLRGDVELVAEHASRRSRRAARGR